MKIVMRLMLIVSVMCVGGLEAAALNALRRTGGQLGRGIRNSSTGTGATLENSSRELMRQETAGALSKESVSIQNKLNPFISDAQAGSEIINQNVGNIFRNISLPKGTGTIAGATGLAGAGLYGAYVAGPELHRERADQRMNDLQLQEQNEILQDVANQEAQAVAQEAAQQEAVSMVQDRIATIQKNLNDTTLTPEDRKYQQSLLIEARAQLSALVGFGNQDTYNRQYDRLNPVTAFDRIKNFGYDWIQYPLRNSYNNYLQPKFSAGVDWFRSLQPSQMLTIIQNLPTDLFRQLKKMISRSKVQAKVTVADTATPEVATPTSSVVLTPTKNEYEEVQPGMKLFDFGLSQ